LTACILPFLSWVPIVGGFAGIAAMICMILAVKQMRDAAIVLVGDPTSGRAGG